MTDQEAKPKRRLAAIMATDIVGYSKLMRSRASAPGQGQAIGNKQ
jgi:class 3 adenylate cyclase